MNVLMLVMIILGCSLQNVVKKPYTQQLGDRGAYMFGVISTVAALLFFVVTSGGGLTWEAGIIPYAAVFGLSYASATVGVVIALSCGSMSLTTLITSYSLILPTVYGLVFLKDPISIGLFPGLALLVISLVLVTQKTESVPITAKWVIWVLITFVGNGMCSVTQKMQQIAFDGAYKNEFMIIALIIVIAILGVMAVIKERKNAGECMRAGWFQGPVCGLMNGMVNLFVMKLSGKMPVSVMFPLISAGGIIVTYVASRLVFKEKLTRRQFIGFVLGVISVVLLNI